MSERLQRYVLWLAAFALIGGTALALRFARGYRPAAGYGFAGVPSPLPGDIALRFEKVHVVGRRNNRRAWELNAAQIDTTKTHGRVDFSGGIVATLLQNERPRATFTAAQATYDVGGQTLVAAGGIACRVFPVGASRSGNGDKGVLRFQAAEVDWNIGGQTVVCPGRVQVDTDGLTVRGDSLQVNLQTREHSLKHFAGESTLTTEGIEGLPAAAETLKGLVP